MSVNAITSGLRPYPMEELARIRKDLIKQGKKVYDFGTGDPKIPTWKPIREALSQAIPEISQYPSVVGLDELNEAFWQYMHNRYGMKSSASIKAVPTSGSKEAIFNIGLCLIGRAGGKKTLIYPNPGYPVYRTSALFAGGTPYPVDLHPENGYLLEPWKLPIAVQKDAAAIWINYPHNPTGAMAPRSYFEAVIRWAEEHDVVVLSDDCYIDIYHPRFDQPAYAAQRPINPITITHKNLLSFMSLSKRSGITGYRCGYMVGDANLINPILRARANFGVGMSDMVQKAAAVAWRDEQHVAERRKLFAERMDIAGTMLKKMQMLKDIPESTFYLWCPIPSTWKGDDVSFCLKLAEHGVITSPSQWLSENMRGFVRFALVPEIPDIKYAMGIVQNFLEKNA